MKMMKNIKKYVLSALMVAFMALTLCSCGGKTLEGTYVVYEYGGKDIDTVIAEAKEEAEAQDVEITPAQYLSLTFDANKNVKMTVMGATVDGTYEVSGDTVTMKVKDKEISATVNGNEISWTDKNITAKLKKQ